VKITLIVEIHWSKWWGLGDTGRYTLRKIVDLPIVPQAGMYISSRMGQTRVIRKVTMATDGEQEISAELELNKAKNADKARQLFEAYKAEGCLYFTSRS
jgi:hypothetical protein